MYLLDTNVLIQLQVRQDTIAKSAIQKLERQGYLLGIVPQNAAEFWNVCTRPAEKNGLGFSIETTTQKLQRIEESFTLFTGDEKAIFQQWKQLVKHHSVKGTKVHYTRLVAAMLVHGLTHILTFNVNDFQRFNEITATHPKTI